MTTETLTPPAATAAPATSTTGTFGVIGLVLSIVSIPFAMGPLAIAGVILGFIGRSKEPQNVTTANWAIGVGLVSLFGWIVLGLLGAMLALPFAITAWAVGLF